MNKLKNQQQTKPKLNRLGFFIIVNVFMVVMVGKGVIHISKGAPVGIGELLIGTLVLICMPWVQDNARNVKPDWAPPSWVLVLFAFFALYAYFSMIGPFF